MKLLPLVSIIKKYGHSFEICAIFTFHKSFPFLNFPVYWVSIIRSLCIVEDSVKELFLKISQNPQENTCARVCEGGTCNFIKNETLAQVLSCEFCEILRTPLLQNLLQCIEIFLLKHNKQESYISGGYFYF